MKFERLPDGSWRYVGRLSGRSWRHAGRTALWSAASLAIWSVLFYFVYRNGMQPIPVLEGFVALLATLFTLAALGLLRGLITGQVYEQIIDERGVYAFNPFRPMFIPAARVDAITSLRRPFSDRVDVRVIFRTWRFSNGPIDLWTDEGMTEEEFEDLYDDLTSRGFG